MPKPIPPRMAAIAIKEPGGPEVLTLEEMETPAPGAGEVLIEVSAAGVNRPDIVQRKGFYPPPPGAPDTPGLEVAGNIVALGDPSGAFKLGDRVCALVTGGGYAEYCTAPAATCLPVPEHFSLIEAAGLPETFFTVWSNVFDRAGLKSGERFLVHGGASGIGTTAIQLAKAFGGQVAATAGSDAKCRKCLELGADLAINYNEQDYVEVIGREWGSVDVILDMVGGDYLARNVQCLSVEGRHVSIAFLTGSKVHLDFMPVMLKRLTLTGSTLRARDTAFKQAIAQNLAQNVWPLLESGAIKPVIDSALPLVQAAEAHARMESGGHIGKIILTTGNNS